MPDLETGPYLCTLFAPMEVEREKVEGVWRDISMLVQPSRSTEDWRSRGRDRTAELYDDTAKVASIRLAALFSHSLTSPANEWAFLQQVDTSFRDRDVDLWLEEATRVLFSIFRSPRAGFNSAINEAYLDLVSFGTASIFVSGDNGIKFNCLDLRELYFAKNEHGDIDTVFRKKWWTADQAAGMFGVDNLSEGVKRKYESTQRYTDDTEYLHAVFPVEDVKNDPNLSALPTRFKFASVYVDRESKHIVKMGGYETFPFAVGRFKVSSGELYGSSPATDTIDSIRLIQAISRSILVSATKSADVPLVVADDSVIGKLNANPGGVTYIRNGSKIDTLPAGDSKNAFVMLQDERQFIRESFFNDIDQLPLQDRMTAFETAERRVDRQQRLSPFSSRIQDELLNIIIERTLHLAVKNEALRQPPARLIDSGGIGVEYISPLAISQRSSKIQSVQMWINSQLPLMQIDPTVVHNINTEGISAYLADVLNIPPSLVRPPEEVAELREQQKQLSEFQQLAQAGQSVAETAKTAAEADAIAGKIGA